MCSVSVETKDETGELLSINQFSTFIVGAGGFGGKRTSQHAKVDTIPQSCACLVFNVNSGFCSQTLFYFEC